MKSLLLVGSVLLFLVLMGVSVLSFQSEKSDNSTAFDGKNDGANYCSINSRDFFESGAVDCSLMYAPACGGSCILEEGKLEDNPNSIWYAIYGQCQMDPAGGCSCQRDD